MALQKNQVDDVFQAQLGRTATPYEYSQYAPKSIQDLASVGKTYGSLNKDQSIVDYLRYNGQDPSNTSRTALAQKYGIANYSSSAEQNIALLNHLKGGTTTPINAQDGTLNNPPPVQNVGKTIENTPGKTPEQLAAEGAPKDPTADPASTPGSISAAASSSSTSLDYTPPPPNPALKTALDSYQSVQSQIAGIDNALASSLAAKKQQIAASGGIVNETELRGMVQAENAPLIAQRRELATQQGQLGSQYQAMLKQQNVDNAESYKTWQSQEQLRKDKATADSKSASNAIAQERVDISSTKIEKTAAYDVNGNKTGDVLTLVNSLTGVRTPLTTTSSGALSPASIHTISSGPVGDPSTKSAATIQSFSTPAYATGFITNADAPTDENQGVKVPGTSLTVGGLYQDAMQFMSDGKAPPRGSKTIQINTYAAITSKAASILQELGITMPAYRASFKANEAALNNNMKMYGMLNVNEKAATANFKTLLGLSKKADAATVSAASPVIESWIRTGVVATTGNADVNNFAGQLVLTMNEYAKVITGQTTGAAVSDSARQETEKLLSTGFNAATIQSFYDNVASKDINNRVNAAKDTITNLVGGITTGTPGLGDTSAPQSVQDKAQAAGYDYNAMRQAGYTDDQITQAVGK